MGSMPSALAVAKSSSIFGEQCMSFAACASRRVDVGQPVREEHYLRASAAEKKKTMNWTCRTPKKLDVRTRTKKVSFRLSENPCCLEHFEAMACCNRLLAPPSLSKFRPRTLFKMLQTPHSKPHILQAANRFASHPRGSSCLSASNHNHKSSKCQKGQFQRFSSAVSLSILLDFFLRSFSH